MLAQGELAMSKGNYIAIVLGIEKNPEFSPAISPVSMLFTIGDHPSKEGDEPTIVDHTRTKSELQKHSNSGV